MSRRLQRVKIQITFHDRTPARANVFPSLYSFNFSDELAADIPREPIDTQEAIRLIHMKLQVTKLAPPGEDDGQGLPVVHFKGTSRSMHASWDPNANSTLRGPLALQRDVFSS